MCTFSTLCCCLQVIGLPSKDLMEEMGNAEKKRLASQAEELGENGLAEKKKELDNAVEENEVNQST